MWAGIKPLPECALTAEEGKMAFFAVSAHGAAEDGVMGSGLP